jgi:hypothetical protein
VDKGSILPDGGQEIVFQANKNTKDKGVRQSAQENSHRIVAKIAVDPNNGGGDIIEDALKSFEDNN